MLSVLKLGPAITRRATALLDKDPQLDHVLWMLPTVPALKIDESPAGVRGASTMPSFLPFQSYDLDCLFSAGIMFGVFGVPDVLVALHLSLIFCIVVSCSRSGSCGIL